jgi:hypothetical protein
MKEESKPKKKDVVSKSQRNLLPIKMEFAELTDDCYTGLYFCGFKDRFGPVIINGKIV